MRPKFHILESSCQLRPHADLATKYVDDVDQDTEAQADEAQCSESPSCAHVVEHEDAKMSKRSCDEEGWDQEGGNCRACEVGVGV